MSIVYNLYEYFNQTLYNTDQNYDLCIIFILLYWVCSIILVFILVRLFCQQGFFPVLFSGVIKLSFLIFNSTSIYKIQNSTII